MSGCCHQNLKENVQMFCTFDRQAPIAGRYFRHCKDVVYNVIIPQESNFILLFLHRTYGKPASSSRMLHSASIIGRNLVIFGGNTYNGTTSVEKCHSDKISVYNLGKYYKVDYNQQSLYIVISQTFCIFIVNMYFIYICKIIFVRIV